MCTLSRIVIHLFHIPPSSWWDDYDWYIIAACIMLTCPQKSTRQPCVSIFPASLAPISSLFLPQLFISHRISCYKAIQYTPKNISMLWDMATIISSVDIVLLAVSCNHNSRCHLFTPRSHPSAEARFFTECWMMINKSLPEITEAYAAVEARSLVLCDGFYFNSVVRWSNNLI